VSNAAIIGLISDTHGLLRCEALASLQGSDLIIHAGDIGDAKILDRLQEIAPVTAVRGNIDKAPWASRLQMTEVVEAGPAVIYVLHDIQDLEVDPAISRFDVVVSGHSHKPSKSFRSGVLYVNPGSAGPRRFKLPVSVARLSLSPRQRTVEFIDLLKVDARLP
jgi:uncharacterized protein